MKTLVITAVIGMGILGVLQAAENATPERTRRGGQGCEDLRRAHQENRELARKQREQREEAIEAFKKGLEGVLVDERIDKIIDFRTELHADGTAFHAAQKGRMVDAINACEHIPADRKSEMLERIGKRHDEAVAFHSGIHDEVMAFLHELKGSEQPAKEKMESWKTFIEGIREKVADWRESHRPRRGERGDRPQRAERHRPNRDADA